MHTNDVEGTGTLAEALGLTEELAEAIARIAEDELAAGRPDPARVILEGLVVANPRALAGWLLLARVHRALGQPLAARFCAEVAGTLAPAAAEAQLGRAEGLLPFPEEREQARRILSGLVDEEGVVAARARSLLAALGGGRTAESDRSGP